MFDKKAFRSLSYGLYIIGSQAGDKRAGCVVNTFQQVTSSPAQVSVAVNKENATCAVIQDAGRFTAVALSEDAPMKLIGNFGFKTSSEVDKFSRWPFAEDETGVPYVSQHVVSRFSVRVVNQIDVGSHILFIGKVDEAEVLSADKPMTYAYYYQVKGGKTPSKASSYSSDEVPAERKSADGGASGHIAWKCTNCGHIENVDELPDDFTCPVCGKGKELFVRIAAE